MKKTKYDVVIVGAGFTGLAAAFELAKSGKKVCVLEAGSSAGGLAGTFEFSDGVELEMFYHHWFNNDTYVPDLVRELGLSENMMSLPGKTGMYYNGRIWKLSTPLDLLRFKALRFSDRIRLGLMILKVRKMKDWKSIEKLNIREWLEALCGKRIYDVVWRPLVDSKFSIHAENISAVWMWKKLVLRGGTRDKKGGEELVYFRGGFGALSKALVQNIEELGSSVKFNFEVEDLITHKKHIKSVKTKKNLISGNQFLFTPAFPIIAKIFQSHVSDSWVKKWNKIKYLGNMCLVLRLEKSLSETYWINVNEPNFPFVGVIEHTNFDSPKNYDGSYIAYLSKYTDVSEKEWAYDDETYMEFAKPYLKRMFPKFSEDWIIDYKVWRAEFAQPVTERNYSRFVPDQSTPFENGYISTMAQIYPEDRGTNYAIREGRRVARLMLDE